MPEWAIVLIVGWAILQLVICGLIIANFHKSKSYEMFELPQDFALPYRLYRSSRMNWVGAWICSIWLFLAIPLAYIAQVIWWLFHIGRKEKE